MIDPRQSLIQIIEQLPMLDGRFHAMHRLDATAGGGQFSLVFRALDAQTGRRVALKFFDPLKMGDAYRWACFEREAKLLEEHRRSAHIVHLVASQSTICVVSSTEQGTPWPIPLFYYAMELAKTNTFRLTSQSRLDTAMALDVFQAMCRGVQYLHRHDLVHRDLKPHNYLVMPNGRIVIGDFGTTRDLSEPPLMPLYGHPPGDVRYTPPEVIACLHDENPRYAIGADFYALGAILFELLTARPLYAQLFNDQFVAKLWQCFAAIDPSERRAAFDATIPAVVDAHPLPQLSSEDRVVPPCVHGRLTDLYRSLCHLDYRGRVSSFESVLRQVRICQIVLAHERDDRERLAIKRARRAARLERRRRKATVH